MLGWKKHKLESRLLGEISITSDMQMTPPLSPPESFPRPYSQPGLLPQDRPQCSSQSFLPHFLWETGYRTNKSPDKPPTLSSLPFTCWFDSPLVLPHPPAASCLSARTEPPRCSMEASSPGGPYCTGRLLAPPPPVADSAGRQWGRSAHDKPSPQGGSETGNVGVYILKGFPGDSTQQWFSNFAAR